MAIQRGSGTGTISLTGYNIPCTITNFSIVNTSEGNINVTIYIVDKYDNQYAISALSYSLKTNQAYIRDSRINLNPYDYIKIESTDTIDYYFSIE